MAILVSKDISLAHQMAEDVIGRGLIPLKAIEWHILSFSSGTNVCGHLPENCSVDHKRRHQMATESPPVAEITRNVSSVSHLIS